MAFRIYDLTCEYMSAPLGLDEPRPRMSYKLASDEPECVQVARRLQLSLSEDFAAPVYDSGMVRTDETLHAEADLKLRPLTRYFFRITSRDDRGREASAVSFFETGFLGTAWRAKWITRPDDRKDDPVVPRFVRRFRLPEAPVRARLYITACGVYRAQINGQYAAPDLLAPGWTSYNKIHQYQTYDVTELLSAGQNELSALVGVGWFCGNLIGKNRRNVFGDRTALLCRLDMTFADGRTRRIVSDERFRWCESEVRLSEIYHGEDIDARVKARPLQPVALLDRGFSMLRGQQSAPVAPVEEIEPVALFTTPKGERVVDFGQNMVGFVRVRVKAPAGREIRLRHFEVLDRDGNCYFENYRTDRAVASYITDGGEDVFEALLTFYGFRYVCIEAFPGEPDLSAFTGVVIHSDLAQTNSFSCSHPLLNRLQSNILWGQKGNFVDIPTDCPQRDERLGWTGDTQVFCSTGCFNMASAGFYSKWIRDVVADQEEDGLIPHIVPNAFLKRGNGGACGWADCITIVPMTVAQRFDDLRLLREAWPAMKRWVAYMKNWGDDPDTYIGHFHFGDWLGQDGDTGTCKGATNDDLIACAFYALSARLTAQCAERLGKPRAAASYRRLFERIRAAFMREFVTPSGRLACSPRNQTAYVLALHFGLLEGAARSQAIDGLLASLKQSHDRLTTGFLGTPYLCETLAETGHIDNAFRLLVQEEFPSWLYSVKMCATTIWEHWDGIRPDGSFWSPSMNSYNHYAYGCIGDWMYRYVGGLRHEEDAPGWKRFAVSPTPGGGITSADLDFDSPRGRIGVHWKLTDGRMRISLSVPANTSADFTPAGAAEEPGLRITRNGKPVAFDGAPLPSGDYEIDYAFAEPAEK